MSRRGVGFAQLTADLPHRQDAADLVVDRHHRDQHRPAVHRVQHLLGGDFALVVRFQADNLPSLALEKGDGVEHRIVLDGSGDNPPARALLRPRRAQNGEVVRLGAAGGEVDFPRLAAQRLRYLRACLLQTLLGGKTLAVQRGGVAVDQPGRFLPGPGSGAVVVVNFPRQKTHFLLS